jgi:hypothetical protein
MVGWVAVETAATQGVWQVLISRAVCRDLLFFDE